MSRWHYLVGIAAVLGAGPGAFGGAAFAQATKDAVVQVVELSEPRYLDMIQDGGRVGQRTGSLVLEPLVHSDTNMRLTPGLATSWSRTGPDTWRFELRKGVRFHNGEEFTADAVKFAVERTKRISSYGAYYSIIKEVTVVEPHVVEFRTTIPTTVVPAIMSVLWMIPPKHVQGVGDRVFGKEPVGTGPFRFKEWVAGKSMAFVRNDDYWGKKASIGGINWRWSTDASARTSLLLAGDVDIAVNLPPQLVGQVETSPRAKLVSGITNRTVSIFFDKDAPVVNDVAVRRAIAHLIDRETLVTALLGSTATPTPRLLIETIFPAAGRNDGDAIKYDVAAARQVLEKANPRRSLPIPIDFHFTPERHPLEGEFAEAIIASLEGSGLFKVERHIREPGAHLEHIYRNNMGGMFILSGGPTYPHPDVTMRTFIVSNAVVHYCEYPEIDRKIGEAVQLEGEAADALYTQIERDVLLENVCMVPLYRINDQHGVSKRLNGLKVRLNEFLDFQDVSVTTP